MSTSAKILLFSFLIFFFSWVISYNIGVNTLEIQSEDTVPSLILPIAIIKDHTLYLDKYYLFMRERYPQPDDKDFERNLVPFYLRRIIKPQSTGLTSPTDNSSYGNSNTAIHYLSAFPIITPLLVLPIYFVAYLVQYSIDWHSLAVLGHLSASLIMAISGAYFYKLLKDFFVTKKEALLLTIVYLFGTLNYALLSQALWQHGTVQLFYILSLYYLLKSFRQTSKTYQILLFGFFYGLAILSRPTALVALPFFAFLVLKNYYPDLKKILNYALMSFLGVLPNILFFIWYNQTYYLSILNQGYADQAGSGWLGKFPEGFLGLWLSPSKGILIYSPIFIFSIISIFQILRSKTYEKNLNYLMFFAIVVVHTLVLGKWKHWYGGWSYGYRMASDIIPFLVLLLVPFLKSSLYLKYKKVFFVVLFVSILVQIHGIIFYDGVWHSAYDGGFENTSWLWSLKDSEFVFNFRRILVKLDLLEKACPNCLGN